jgi:hypothetical protein
LSVYLDSLTVIMAIVALVFYSDNLVKKCDFNNVVSFIVVFSYLLAQSIWTTSWFLGDVWGRDLGNYVWFVFNTSVMVLLLKLRGK